MEIVIRRHVFSFNDDVNGGEVFSCMTVFTESDGKIDRHQELTLRSYCNSATFTLNGALMTPAALRRLADELEATEKSLLNKSANV